MSFPKILGSDCKGSKWGTVIMGGVDLTPEVDWKAFSLS